MSFAEQSNVIFVDFASSERITGRDQKSAQNSRNDFIEGPDDSNIDSRESFMMSELFTRMEVSRLFSIKDSRLRYWDRSDFIKPSGMKGRRRYYTFQDLISIRAVKTLLESGVSLQRAKRMLEGLRKALPRVSRPLNELRIRADGSRIIATSPEGSFEPESGQLLLDFDVKDLNTKIIEMRSDGQKEQPKTAFDWYVLGCRLDDEPGASDRAEAAYRNAIKLDPNLSNSYTNLGNIYYRRNDISMARDFYMQALEVDPDQPEAHYNLGFLYFDMGQPSRAIPLFEKAIEMDPEFADAYFNLAMSLFESGRYEDSKPYWKKYLDLEPRGPWADLARRRLREIKD